MRNFGKASSIDTATLSDEDLVRGINASKDQSLVDEFYKRYRKVIERAARIACYRANRGSEMDEGVALSEAYLAVMDALRLYDFKSSSLKTFIAKKIRYHFLDLDRRDAIHTGRETPLSSFEAIEGDDGDTYYGTEYVEAKVDKERFLADQRRKELGDACARLRSTVSVRRHQECLDAFQEAFERKVRKPKDYVAIKLGCSRQQVYNILKQIRKNIPEDLAEELHDIL